MKYAILALALLLGACSGSSSPPPGGSSGYTYPYAHDGQWVTYGGNEPQVTQGPPASWPVPCCNTNVLLGYVYTNFATPPKPGQTLTLNYSLTGNNPIFQQAPYGSGQSDTNPPTIHLFLWRKSDNLLCDSVTVNYRMFASRTNLVLGANQTVSVPLDPSQWTGCYAGNDNASQFADLLNNLAGVGVTFGGQSFAGHGIYLSSGNATFTINSFTVH